VISLFGTINLKRCCSNWANMIMKSVYWNTIMMINYYFHVEIARIKKYLSGTLRMAIL